MTATGDIEVNTAAGIKFKGYLEAYFKTGSQCDKISPPKKLPIKFEVCGTETVKPLSVATMTHKFNMGKDPSFKYNKAKLISLFKSSSTACPVVAVDVKMDIQGNDLSTNAKANI